MKYLKEYNEMWVKDITIDRYYQDINTTNANLILRYLDKRNILYKKDKSIFIYPKNLTINNRKIQSISISLISDEWYKVILFSHIFNTNDHRVFQYKCDQIDGVIDLLNTIFDGKLEL